MNDNLQALSDAGVAIWLDDISRPRLTTGNLAELVREKGVVGVTSNPTIFAKALSEGDAYDEQLRSLAADGADVDKAIRTIITDDIRDAADVLKHTYDAGGGDGMVSIEVDPGLAHDTQATIDEAATLNKLVGRPNVFIKIPATKAGLPAITATLAAGINVNVTLIFSLERYRAVMDAWLTGIEQARDAGHDVSTLISVASFFVSRVDSEVDKRLDKVEGHDDEVADLRAKAAIANARLAFAAYEEVLASDRWKALEQAGVSPQRPLWASTSTKDPDLPDTLYVTELVTKGVVNTMPEATINAFADHGKVSGDTVRGRAEEAQTVLDRLEALGIHYDEVVQVLEDEGVQKFAASWTELQETVSTQLSKAGASV
jgi:transaldolase